MQFLFLLISVHPSTSVSPDIDDVSDDGGGALVADDAVAAVCPPSSCLQGDVASAELHGEDGPPNFDICYAGPPPAQRRRPMPSRAGANAPPQVSGVIEEALALQEGLVLVRGLIGLETQAEIVRTIRSLGTGEGGFYTPSYSGGGELRLKMMCLGMHWEPRTAQYEDIRSSHDGARPPPIPAALLELVQGAVLRAQSVSGAGRLPPVSPDVCLCNFYEKSGRLGMHQDKDESRESLRAGIPVVSFSIGDTAEFLYGDSRDEGGAQVVELKSGDVLIFGGKSRMLFHSVSRILPNTCPLELLQATGLAPGRLNLTFRQL